MLSLPATPAEGNGAPGAGCRWQNTAPERGFSPFRWDLGLAGIPHPRKKSFASVFGTPTRRQAGFSLPWQGYRLHPILIPA